MNALTKAEITDELSKKIGLNKREAKQMVEVFFKEIADELAQGHPVKLSGFGNFNLRDKSERPGRNPKTGIEVAIKPRRVVTFHAGQKLKARVESYVGPELQAYGGDDAGSDLDD